MSMIDRPAPEPVEATPRASMTPARRRRIGERQGPICARSDCDRPWTEVDHIVPLALGGADKDHNCEGLCEAHHAQKTATDIATIRRAQRLERDHNPATRRKSPHRIRSRGFRKADPLKG